MVVVITPNIVPEAFQKAFTLVYVPLWLPAIWPTYQTAGIAVGVEYTPIIRLGVSPPLGQMTRCQSCFIIHKVLTIPSPNNPCEGVGSKKREQCMMCMNDSPILLHRWFLLLGLLLWTQDSMMWALAWPGGASHTTHQLHTRRTSVF